MMKASRQPGALAIATSGSARPFSPTGLQRLTAPLTGPVSYNALSKPIERQIAIGADIGVLSRRK